MPRRGSDLVKFLREALCENRYSNLLWINQTEEIFCLKCIHGGNKEWTKKGCKIFQDWKNMKKRRKTDKNEFSEGRQRLLAAMNKCKSIMKFKKESSCSVKYYQFIDGGGTDSESASSGFVSDGEMSPEPVGMEGVESFIETMANDFKIIPPTAFKFPPEIQEDMIGGNSDMPISTEDAIDPKFLTDCIKNVTLQDLRYQLVSPPDINEAVCSTKMNLLDACIQEKQETEFYNLENCAVDNLISFTENSAGDAAEDNNLVATDNPVAAKNEMLLLDPDSTVGAPQESYNPELPLPPIRLFRCGEYLIGITKVPAP